MKNDNEIVTKDFRKPYSIHKKRPYFPNGFPVFSSIAKKNVIFALQVANNEQRVRAASSMLKVCVKAIHCQYIQRWNVGALLFKFLFKIPQLKWSDSIERVSLNATTSDYYRCSIKRKLSRSNMFSCFLLFLFFSLFLIARKMQSDISKPNSHLI